MSKELYEALHRYGKHDPFCERLGNFTGAIPACTCGFVEALALPAEPSRVMADGRLLAEPPHGAHPIDGYTYAGCPGCHPLDVARLRVVGFVPDFNVCGGCHHRGGEHDLNNICLICGDFFGSMSKAEQWEWAVAEYDRLGALHV